VLNFMDEVNKVTLWTCNDCDTPCFAIVRSVGKDNGSFPRVTNCLIGSKQHVDWKLIGYDKLIQ
jgi:hypothetical protein